MSISEKKELAIETCLAETRESLKKIKYGTITIVIQDGIPIQIEETEKKRFKDTSK